MQNAGPIDINLQRKRHRRPKGSFFRPPSTTMNNASDSGQRDERAGILARDDCSASAINTRQVQNTDHRSTHRLQSEMSTQRSWSCKDVLGWLMVALVRRYGNYWYHFLSLGFSDCAPSSGCHTNRQWSERYGKMHF